MANIRTRLIHMLGGVTRKEHDDSIRMAKRHGAWDAFMDTLNVMEKEYGNQEWGSVVYNYVKDSLLSLIDRT